MIDLFGIKARKQVKELKKEISHITSGYRRELATAAQSLHVEQGRAAGFSAQVVQLRGIAEELRGRVHSHGMTTAERVFLDVCLDIYKNGKKISEFRFNNSMAAIVKQREQLKNDF